jgi:lipooligosaccharide transport system permease protein
MSWAGLDLSRRFLRVWQRNRDVYFATWKTNLLPQLGEPFLYVVAFGLGLGALVGEVMDAGRSVSYLRFLAPGMIGVGMIFQSYFEGTYGSYVRMYYQRTFAAQMTTPLSVEDVILGEIAWAATKAGMSTVLMTLVLGSLRLVELPTALWVLPLSFLAGVIFGCFGLMITALSPSIDFFNIPYVFVFSPMFLFSGTFFPLAQLPDWMEALAWTMPLTHVVDAARAACLNRPLTMPAVTLTYLLVSALVMIWLSVVMMRRRLVP